MALYSSYNVVQEELDGERGMDVTLANVPGAGFGEASYRGAHPQMHALLAAIEDEAQEGYQEGSLRVRGAGEDCLLFRLGRPWRVQMFHSGTSIIEVGPTLELSTPDRPTRGMEIPFRPALLLAVSDRMKIALSTRGKGDREEAARAALLVLRPLAELRASGRPPRE